MGATHIQGGYPPQVVPACRSSRDTLRVYWCSTCHSEWKWVKCVLEKMWALFLHVVRSVLSLGDCNHQTLSLLIFSHMSHGLWSFPICFGQYFCFIFNFILAWFYFSNFIVHHLNFCLFGFCLSILPFCSHFLKDPSHIQVSWFRMLSVFLPSALFLGIVHICLASL